MNISIKISLAVMFVGLLLWSCRPEVDEPTNPFDEIDYSVNEPPEIEVDANSFLGLHKEIFSASCSLPGCHDGSFEPDFRTVQSAYHTLVRHEVVKNYIEAEDGQDPLPFRVTPGEPSQSMMWHRITQHNPPKFELMPSSGNPLSQEKLDRIEQWILDGAPDVYGDAAVQSSYQPACYGVYASLPNQSDYRVDTIRGDFNFNPFATFADEDLELWFLYLDVTPANDTIFGNELEYNKIQFSTNAFDFSDAVEVDLQKEVLPELINNVFSEDFVPLPNYHHVTINPTDLGFVSGDLIYMRTYVRDSDHPNPTEIPTAESPIYLKTYFSFYIQ